MELRGLYLGFTFLYMLLRSLTAASYADQVSVEDYYRSVLTRMARMSQPSLVAYEMVARAEGAAFYVTREPSSGEGEFGFSVGDALGNTDQRWPVFVRTRDTTTSVRLDGTYAVTRFPALNATWGGIESWMRFGMQDASGPSPSPSPLPHVRPGDSQPPVIAVVRSLGLSIYRVSEGGESKCDDGSPARVLHLTARDNRSRHPATDITVQSSTDAVCTIRFEIERSALVARNGYVELHIIPVGAYYLVNRGEISFKAGPRLGGRQIRLFLDYIGITFPAVAPAGTFVTPAPGGLPGADGSAAIQMDKG